MNKTTMTAAFALLISGMVGYGLAYLIHSQSQGRSSFRAER